MVVTKFFEIWAALNDDGRLAFAERMAPAELLNFYKTLDSQVVKSKNALKGPVKENVGLRVITLEKEIQESMGKYESYLNTLAYAARSRVGKILNCKTQEGDNALQNRTCKPLLNSENKELTEDQRNAQPFKEATLTADYWVQLLPVVDIFNRWFKNDPENYELWKIYFIDVINEIKRQISSRPTQLSFVKEVYREHKIGRLDDKYVLFCLSPAYPITTVEIFRATVKKYPTLKGSGSVTYHDTFYDKINPTTNATPNPIDVLKNDIKNLYFELLPPPIQKYFIETIPAGYKELHAPYYNLYGENTILTLGFYIEKLIDDQYVKDNVQNFLKMTKELKDQPRQVICPRKFISPDTRKETPANTENIIFFEPVIKPSSSSVMGNLGSWWYGK